MNILWLAPHPVPSDKNTHPAPWITSLANHLVNAGHDVTIIAVSKNIKFPLEEFNDYFTYKFIVVKAPSFYNDVFTLFRGRINVLCRFLKKYGHNYDLIHIHGTEHQLGASYFKAKGLTPSVISIQGIIHKYKNYIPDIVSKRRFFWELSSYYEKKEIIEGHYFFCRTHWDVSVVRSLNLNAQIFNVWELLRNEFYQYSHKIGGKDILFFGGSNSLKGLEPALRVFDRLLLLDDSMRMHIVGNCSSKILENLKNKNNLKNIDSNNLYLHGVLSALDIITIYKKCYCLYHPSLIDNSPNSICEAQLVGLPVVANNVGGVSSLIEEGKTGFLVTPNNTEEHVSLLYSLRGDLELQLKIAREARRSALSRHNPESIVDDTITAYKEILSKNGNTISL